MVRGVITTKDLMLHPVSTIEAFGFRKYLYLLVNCITRKPMCLIDLIWK